MQVLNSICQICNKEFNSLKGLHSHISKSHTGWSISDYYHYHFPRKDLYTNEFIKFKNHTQYFEDNFNSRENFSAWLLDNYKLEEAKKLCINNLLNRCARKNNYILPPQFDLKGLMIPTVGGWEKIFSTTSLEAGMESLGITLNYNYNISNICTDNYDYIIYQDSREQLPFLLDCNVQKVKLPVGDYTISEPYFSNIYIERKSLSDLVGTLTGGYDRFINEIEKAKSIDAYLVVIVEDLYSELYHYNSINKFTKKVNGQYILRKIREITSQYSNIQFVAAGSRRNASDLCIKILKMKDLVKSIDLEYAKDNRLI